MSSQLGSQSDIEPGLRTRRFRMTRSIRNSVRPQAESPTGSYSRLKSGVFPEMAKIPVLPGISLDEFYGASLHSIFASTKALTVSPSVQ
jgi:hypothetical protein